MKRTKCSSGTRFKRAHIGFISLLSAAIFVGCSGSGIRILNKGFTNTRAASSESAAEQVRGYTALNYDEQKAVWISYIELADFLSKGTESSFEDRFKTAILNIKESGFNTVYVHVRAFGDAYYSSALFPKAQILDGTDFDPLEIMVKLAHESDISFHAWFNPFRCQTVSAMENIDDGYQTKQWVNEGSGIIKTVDGDDHYWLNPAYDEVIELICGGVKELLDGYEIDGVHFDDYFFPSTDEEFDKDEFMFSGFDSQEDYRIQRVNKMVSSVFETIKKSNDTVLFGLSPQGNIDNDYQLQFADVKKWCSEEGYCDYIVPQVYYGYSSTCPYLETIESWNELCTVAKLVIGLGEYKIISEEEFISTKGIIANMINDAKELSGYSGVAVYNYKNLFEPDEADSERVMAEKELIEESIE